MTEISAIQPPVQHNAVKVHCHAIQCSVLAFQGRLFTSVQCRSIFQTIAMQCKAKAVVKAPESSEAPCTNSPKGLDSFWG